MNTNLKKLAKGKSGLAVVLCILLGVLIAACAIGLVGTMGGKSENPYTSDSKAGDRVYIDAQFASDYFAEFTANAEDKLYFLLDEDANAYIVCIPDSEIEAYSDMQAYTFGETDVVPEVIRTTGTLVAMDDELLEMAIEEFNWFWDEEVVTEANADEFFGGLYYIDTAVSDVSSAPFMLIVVIVALIVVIVLVAKKNSGASSVSKRTLAALESTGEAERINGELQDIRTKRYGKLNVYLTENYLVSGENGLKVVPLATMTGIYGVITEKNYELVIRDNQNVERSVVQTKNKVNDQWNELTALVEAISEQVPGLEYGVNRELAEAPVDVTQIDQFFAARKSGTSLEVQRDLTNADGTVITPNYGLGVLGALGGALIGGVLWFVVGNLGYIAGIVGFVIIYLSAMGFKLGAKVLTKAGAVIAVLISVIMIFVANYVLYAWSFAEAFEGRFTLMESLVMLPASLKEYELVGDFVKDILIGYALSLIAAFSTLRNMFANKK